MEALYEGGETSKHVCFPKEPVMSEEEKKVDAKSAEFKQGVEAGLNSEADTKNWKAGNELGRELKDEGQTTEPGGTREEL